MSEPLHIGDNDVLHHPEPGETVLKAEVVAAEMSTDEKPRGTPGKPFDRRSPFFVGMAASAGVAVTYGIILLLDTARPVLILIGLAVFLAVGMEPAVTFLERHRLRRWVGVVIVLVLILGIIGAFLASAIPALATQLQQIIKNVPAQLEQLKDHSSLLGKLNDQFHLADRVTELVNSSGTGLTSGVLGAGAVVFTALTDTLIVLVLTAYFLADMPRIRRSVYRMFPESRRPRAILIGDDIAGKVGAYVLGNLIVSLIAGALTLGDC